ncbi:MAG: diguanylate cyclase [Candidatus Omnitrophica bacterium]|nr:diguanylate cyclase [Candidatus Omnitrophota bacterium]
MPEDMNIAQCKEIVERITKEIIPLFDLAIKNDSVLYKNPNLKQCWNEKNCKKESCPVFKNESNLRCWQIAGTYCGGKIQGLFAEKYDNCKMCEVYKKACPTIVEELGENFNNLMYLVHKQKHITADHVKKIDHLNKELFSALENLDLKNREIQELVITDKLTGLYNRNYLFATLEDEISRSMRYDYQFSLLMMDLDDFKKINDEYGHLEGDKILSFLGEMLKTKLRKTDRSFRYGGEEFVIVLPETEMTIAFMVAERIRAAFEAKTFSMHHPATSKDTLLSPTLSIGVISYQKGLSIQDLLGKADEAMYKAKSLGKNKVVRHDELSTL